MQLDATNLAPFAEAFALAPSCLRPLGGSQNHVFLHESPQPVVLRISVDRHRSRNEVNAELGWVSGLASRGLPVPRPIRSTAGRLCEDVSVTGRTHVVSCMQFLAGRKLSRLEFDDSTFAELGRLLGRVHAAGIEYDRTHGPIDRPPWHESRLLNADFSAQTGDLTPTFLATAEKLVDELRTESAGDTHALLHGDPNLGNCLIHDGTLQLFDFDNCEYGDFTQDLATTLYDSIHCGLLHLVPDADLADHVRRRWAVFHDCYGEQRPGHVVSGARLERFLILREAVILVHYLRTLDVRAQSSDWQGGMDGMRHRVEQARPPLDVDQLSGVV